MHGKALEYVERDARQKRENDHAKVGLDGRDDGVLYARVDYVNGVKHGLDEYFESEHYGYFDGLAYSYYSMKNDKMHGIAQSYHMDGKLESQHEWVDGDLHGWTKSWDQSGKLWECALYVHGVRTLDTQRF
jgi:antitoxin component YwqK of YwqJK toxin-antitoxin module